MPFNIQTTLDTIESYLAKSGRVPIHQIGEPKQPWDTNQLAGALWMSSVQVVGLTLSTTIELHVVTLRLHKKMFQEPEGRIETDLAQAVSEISNDFLGDFDLGSTIRNVDAGGQYGTGYSVTWGHVDVSNTHYRVADISIPLVVDDSATLAA